MNIDENRRKLPYTEAHSQGTGKITNEKQTCFNIIATCCHTCVITCVWPISCDWWAKIRHIFVSWCFCDQWLLPHHTKSQWFRQYMGNTCEQHNQQTRPVQHKSESDSQGEILMAMLCYAFDCQKSCWICTTCTGEAVARQHAIAKCQPDWAGNRLILSVDLYIKCIYYICGSIYIIIYLVYLHI